jgi:hypothetical protein
MQYLLILSEDRELMAAEARQNAVERVGEFAMGLVVDGVLQGGSLRRPAEEGKKVRVREGRQRVVDGPFAESKEVMAGYMIIEAADMAAAVDIALRCPNAEFGSGRSCPAAISASRYSSGMKCACTSTLSWNIVRPSTA